MYHYLFTNDLRISELTRRLLNAATKIYNNTVPNADENKSENNNILTLKSYFCLDSNTNCNKYVRNNYIRKVIINFVKKFQFPNFRTPSSYRQSCEDGILLAPLREMTKTLHIAYLSDAENGYLTRTEILDFIFYNSAVAKNSNPNYILLYSQILQYRESRTYPETVASMNERHWKESDRQVREMLAVLEYVGFIRVEGDRYYIKPTENLTTDEKADLYEVITTNEYWQGNTRESYISYFDLPDLPDQSDQSDDNPNPLDLLDFNGEYGEQNDIEYNAILNFPLQKIFFGPPGTGKSYGVTQLIKETYPIYKDSTINNPYVFRTAIHPEYSYYDFVGNIMPVSTRNEEGVEINYAFQKGIFTLALKKAFETDRDVFLVLEEMSRGNIVSIFGDIFQLLDRKDDGSSEYTINIPIITDILNDELEGWENSGIYLPTNLHIIGTVNTSDQNVFVMDTAFKRRFEFEYVETDPEPNLNQFNLTINNQLIDWNVFYPILNDFIVDKLELSEDKQIGQFFIKFKQDDEEYNNNQISNKLLQYLWNDVHLVKMTSISLFRNDLTSFGKLYKHCKENGFTSLISSEFNANFTNINIEENNNLED